MPKPPKAARALAKGPGPSKLHIYEILYQLNQGHEQVLCQLRKLEKHRIGRRDWRKFLAIVEETRAEINFEVVELLQQHELKDWTYFGRLREEHEKEGRGGPQKPSKARPGGRHRQK